MIIQINNQQNDLKLDDKKIDFVVRAVLDLEQVKADEISVNFVDTSTICELHAEYFDDPSPTDCISFPLDDEGEDYRVLGEVFVCPKTAVLYCEENGGDPHLETELYVIHGLLHLIGLDDIEEADRQEMRRREKLHLENLAKKTR